MGVPIGNIKFSRSVDGFGTSGISTGQFEFDLYDENNYYSQAVLQGSTAQLVEKNNNYSGSQIYYISSRSVSKKIAHFVAYDILGQTDKDFDISELIFPETGDHAGSVAMYQVMSAIAHQLGDVTVNYTSGGDYGTTFYFTKEMLENKTIRNVLETVSEALCGVWTAYDGVEINCFGAGNSGTCTAAAYSEIDFQGRQKITKLLVTDTETDNISDFSTGEYGTVISLETPFPDAASAVWERISGTVYTGWNCEKALISPTAPDIPAFTKIIFGDNELIASSFTISVDSTGVYFSGGADPQNDEQWRYEEFLRREVAKKIEVGKTVGNMQITNNGDIIYINKNNLGGGLNGRNGISCYRRSK